jgi:hypothetical protein
METRMFRNSRSVTVLICVLAAACLCLSQEKPTDAEKTANKKGWDDAWAMSNAMVVKNYFDQIYYPQAKALLDAERQLSSGTNAADIVNALKNLPGITGAVVISTKDGGDAQWPDSLVRLNALQSILFNSAASRESKTVSPMTHRTLGGKVKYQQVPMGDEMLDIYVRYVHQDTLSKLPEAAICLVMDRKWLIAQIPAAMDSLYRENSQLLFCAASPINHLWEQSLGVVANKDTLWWVGRKDVTVRNVQPIGPFSGIEVYSYVHTLEKH